MPEANVIYSDVRFTTSKETSRDETTYSEVKLLGAEPVELAVSHPEASDGGSKVTERRLLLLCVLLAAAVVGLCLLSLDNIKTKKNLQTLKDEHDAMRKNLTEKMSELSSCTTAQLISPKPTEAKSTEPCPTDWYQHGGSCYYFSSSKLTWDQSRSDCKGRGADLVQIDSEEEQRFLENKVGQKMNDHQNMFWIGLTDTKEEGRWLWVDDSPLITSLSFWYSNEPDNWKSENPAGENCARMGIKGGVKDLKCWWDQSCDATERSICEKPAKTGR